LLLAMEHKDGSRCQLRAGLVYLEFFGRTIVRSLETDGHQVSRRSVRGTL